MKHAVLTLETLACPTCMQKIEAATKAVVGVEPDSVNVLFNASKVKVQFDNQQTDIDTIAKAIQDIGYQVLKRRVK